MPQWGTFEWGTQNWESDRSIIGQRYAIELRNKQGAVVRVLNPSIAALDWQFDQQGGCGAFSLELKEQYDALRNTGLQGDYDLQVKLEAIDGSTFTTWYRGYVDRVDEVLGDKESVRVSGFGYSRQLNRVAIQTTYLNTEVSSIVKAILGTYVVPKTSIVRDDTRIHPTGFVGGTIAFNTTADKAIKFLADLVGAEFGVDSSQTFYFVPLGQTVMHRYFVGADVRRMEYPRSYDEIVNRVFLEGRNGFTMMAQETDSQVLYGLREQILQVSSITNQADGQQYLTKYLAQKATPTRKMTLQVIRVERPVEGSLPLGLVKVYTPDSVAQHYYGDDVYGGGTYGGAFQAQPTNVRYRLKELYPEVTLQIGESRDAQITALKQLEYELEQARNV